MQADRHRARPASEAMQKAAKEFVDVLPTRINLGLVSFAGTATVAGAADHRPRRRWRNAIDNLELAESTAIGEAIFTSLERDRELPVDRRARRPRSRRRPGSCCSPTATTPSGRADTQAVDAAQGGRRPGVDDRVRHRLRHARPRRRDACRCRSTGRRCKEIADDTGGSYSEAATRRGARAGLRATSAARSATRPSRRTSATGSCAAASCSP